MKDSIHLNSVNHGDEFTKGLPDTIVIHYTAGAGFNSSIKSLTNRESKTSAHLVIGREGQIAQLVPFNIIAWHAGRSEYKGRKNLNKYSIGIELDNAGELDHHQGKYLTWFGREIDDKDVIVDDGAERTYWHRYSDIQLKILMDLCLILCEQYEIKDIVGHSDIAPDRKKDPGPGFPMKKIRSRFQRG